MSRHANGAGSKHRHAIGSDTSAEAAQTVNAKTQREWVLDGFSGGPGTPEQVVARLAKRGVHIMLMSARPRCSELARLGLIRDTTRRGIGAGGCKAIIWGLVTKSAEVQS